jgi:hypothetical protein
MYGTNMIDHHIDILITMNDWYGLLQFVKFFFNFNPSYYFFRGLPQYETLKINEIETIFLTSLNLKMNLLNLTIIFTFIWTGFCEEIVFFIYLVINNFSLFI